MADPTGLSGIVVTKLVEWIIEETKTTRQCQQNCRALNDLLRTIRPLVYFVANKLSANRDGKVVAELGPMEKWLEDLQIRLREAGALVLKCQMTCRGWNLTRRHELSKKILNIKQKIQDICTAEATLASLSIDVSVATGVDDILKLLAQLPLEMGNVWEEILQPYRKEAELAFREIKDQLALVVAGLSDQTSSSQRTYHDTEIRPVTGKSFGLDGAFERLRDLLLGEIQNTEYVVVCGTGGIGKTRLAEMAYNNEDVRDHFQRRIWLTVGQNKSIESLLRKLGEKLHVGTEDLEPDEIKANIFNELLGMKVLFVLDDIWDCGFPILEMLNVTSGPDTGSKILVTTRDIQLLKREGADDQTVMMKVLSASDSWELFREFAFKGVDKIPNVVQKLAKEVAIKCKGLPLALRVVGAALAGEDSPQQWRKALQKLKDAKLLDRGHEIQLYNRLQLSYDELESVENDHPNRLQKCFIFFASFPEDSDVDSEKLVNLWAGEKLLEASDDTDDDTDPLEDGYCLLRELIKRSLIELQEERRSRYVNSRRIYCRVHDVLRDFARHLIRGNRAPMNCFFNPGNRLEKFPDDWLKTSGHGGISDATHLSLNNNHLQSLPVELKAPKLQVLLLAMNSWHPLVIPTGFLENFSSLKVLDLEYTWIASLPETLGSLTNLVYLELSYTGLSKLPKGVCKLTKLEYLGLSGCAEMEPFAIECLKNLCTLNTAGCRKVWQVSTTESELDPLHNVCSLTKLRNLSIEGTREHLPSQMSQLVNLRHLAVSSERLEGLPLELHSSKNGPSLSKLQHLSLIGCKDLSELPSWVESLSHLADLILCGCKKLRSLPNLFKLEELRILDLTDCTFLKQLPTRFATTGAFPALKELNLKSCISLEEFPVTEVGTFPKLEKLIMNHCKGLKQLGEGFASKGAFPALKELCLVDCTALEEFPPIQEGAFPKLEKLWIDNCTGLKELGQGFGSKGAFQTLEYLHMRFCLALEEFPLIKKGAFPKLKRLWMDGCQGLKQLGQGFGSNGAFPALEELSIADCVALEEFPRLRKGAFQRLEKLSMSNCRGIKQLGEEFASKGALPALEVLGMSFCLALAEFPPIQEGAFSKLKKISMSSCKGLQQLGQGFASKSAFPSLEELSISDCVALQEFPPIGEGAFPKLEVLLMDRCINLKQLGEGFAAKRAFHKLKVLNMNFCSSLKEFPPTQTGAFPKLKTLWMDGCEGLKQLGEGFGSNGAFPVLKELTMTDCVALKEFPFTKAVAFPKLKKLWMNRCKGLKQLGEGFASKGAFPALEELKMSDCVSLEEFPITKLGAFPKLKKLWMDRCKGLKQLGEGFASKGAFPGLEVLSISHCVALETFPPVQEGAFPKLEKLWLHNCEGLMQLCGGFVSNGSFPALKEVSMSDCVALEMFPSTEAGAFPKLENLGMHNCKGLKKLGKGFASKGAFPTLKVLNMNECAALEEFPSIEEGAFPKLEKLWMDSCTGLKQLGEGFASKGAFPMLKDLSMSYCGVLEEFPPIEEGAFAELVLLWLDGCKGLKQLGEGFVSTGVFPALKELNVSGCIGLEEFPPIEEGAFQKLEKLWISDCKGLKKFYEGCASNAVFPALRELVVEDV